MRKLTKYTWSVENDAKFKMNRLSEEDRKWFKEFLRVKIQEASFNAYRYQTEEAYEEITKLKRVYNILSYNNN